MGSSFSSIIVPTIDTIRQNWVLRSYVTNNIHALCTGDTGTGKSVSVNQLLKDLGVEKWLSILVNFSAQTSANMTQDIIDGKLMKRRKGVFGPPLGKRCIIFVDDLNMPVKEEYGAQPPIEILRQAVDMGGWYDRAMNELKTLDDIQLIAAMGPPGGGKTKITPRLSRHFNTINYTPFEETSLTSVFNTILNFFFMKFDGKVRALMDLLVVSTIAVYNDISNCLRPTPQKLHY